MSAKPIRQWLVWNCFVLSSCVSDLLTRLLTEPQINPSDKAVTSWCIKDEENAALPHINLSKQVRIEDYQCFVNNLIVADAF